VSADPFGQAIKMAIQHLQAHQSDGSFGYDDMPWWDTGSVSAIGEPDSRCVNSKILRDLNALDTRQTATRSSPAGTV
jgi:hypothetical protein